MKYAKLFGTLALIFGLLYGAFWYFQATIPALVTYMMPVSMGFGIFLILAIVMFVLRR